MLFGKMTKQPFKEIVEHTEDNEEITKTYVYSTDYNYPITLSFYTYTILQVLNCYRMFLDNNIENTILKISRDGIKTTLNVDELPEPPVLMRAKECKKTLDWEILHAENHTIFKEVIMEDGTVEPLQIKKNKKNKNLEYDKTYIESLIYDREPKTFVMSAEAWSDFNYFDYKVEVVYNQEVFEVIKKE
jgi:hypothetical protein